MVRTPFFAAIACSCLLSAGDAHAAAGMITKGPWVQRVTADSAVVRVEVDPPGPVTLEVSSTGGGPDGGPRSIASASAALHSIPLTGLDAGRQYNLSVHAGMNTKVASFVTALPASSDAPFHFLIYGDNRSDDAGHAAVVRAMTPVHGDFLVHTGDFVQDGASLPDWQTFFEIEAPLLSSRCLYSAVGNHELTDGAGVQYVRFFGPTDALRGASRPEHLDGTFRWGNTRFFLLNGMVRYEPGRVDRVWLEKALADADNEPSLRWRIVVTHHGPWSSGPHGGNSRLLDAGVVELFKAHKVDLIVAGHDHVYERGMGELPYVVSGGGGAPTYDVKTKVPATRTIEPVRHFIDVAVSPSALELTAIRADGSTIERCGIAKSLGGWDCDVPSGKAAPLPPRSSRCACDAVGAPSGGAAGLAGAVLVGLVFVRRRQRAWQPDGVGRY